MSKQVPAEHQFYQKFAKEDDEERSRSHYEHDPRFYYYFTGGEWNVYSATIWPSPDSTGTEAQQTKLDLLARQMDLKPGMRILDVGCGWGGPLTYLCKAYGVTGVGITVSPKQRDEAEARAARYGVDATFKLVNWEDFEPGEQFDAIYSDEVIVHFHELETFFRRCWDWLKMGARMVHKELHFTHKAHTVLGRTGANVNQIFGFSGNYRLLTEELQMINNAGFELTNVTQISMANYCQTMDFWLSNLFINRDAVKELVGEQVYTDFRKYLKICRWAFGTTACSLDVITSTKIDVDAILAARAAEGN